METAVVRIKKDITPQKIIKRDLIKDMTNFVQVQNKLSNKKKRLINKNKRKASIRETSLRKAIISSLNSSNKEQLLVSIMVKKELLPKTQDIDIAIIGINFYWAACRLKGAQFYVSSMKDI